MRRLALSWFALVLAACGHTSALVVAVDHGDVAHARVRLDHGADPDAEDGDGDSARMLAVWHRHADLVARMLANHADPDHANDFGATALHWAIDDAATTKLVLDAGARVDAEDATGTTALELAAGRGGGGGGGGEDIVDGRIVLSGAESCSI